MIRKVAVFDQDWYEAQSGTAFADESEAIRDYLSRSKTDYLSPHPLFEPAFFDPQHVRRVQDPLLYFLESPRRLVRAPHPALDHIMGREKLDAGTDSTATWLRFVRSLSPDDHINWPLSSDQPSSSRNTPTWRVLRAALIGAAVQWREDECLSTATRSQVELPTTPAQPVHEIRRPAADHLSPSSRRPRVSVIMPTWNRAPKLRIAIESLQRQTLQDWELIVVDDGSTDDTRAVLDGICAFDPRIRVVHQARSGVCRARNVGLEAAQGAYVAFLDSDNTWLPAFLESVVEFMEREHVPMAHAVLEVTTDKNTYYRAFQGTRKHLLVANHIDLNVLVVTKDLLMDIGGFDESLRRAVDYDLVIRLAEKAELRLVPVVGAAYRDDPSDRSRISVSEPLTWNSVVRSQHLVNWSSLASSASSAVANRVSVVVVVRNHLPAVFEWVEALQSAAAQGNDVELVVVASGSPRAVTMMACAAVAYLPRGRVIHTPRDVGVPLASNVAVAETTGEFVIYARSDVVPESGWLPPLLEALQNPTVSIAQSVVQRPTGVIDNAGGVFAAKDALPQPLLRNFPISDATKIEGALLPAAYAGLIAATRHTVVRLHGLDPLVGNSLPEVDLSLRAQEQGLGRVVLVSASRAVRQEVARPDFPADLSLASQVLNDRWRSVPGGSDDLWKRIGIPVVGVREVPVSSGARRKTVRPVHARASRIEGVNELAPRLRWTIDTSAPAGPKGEKWGDTHFARALATALAEAGQDVAVDVREARRRGTRDLDDVLLVLRGLDKVRPRRTTVNMEWVISHPERVTQSEAASYDVVFAASGHWAEKRTREWGLPVRTLLQCTDPTNFNLDRARPEAGHSLLFVGNSRLVERAAVRSAIAAGFKPVIYGREWEGLVDQSLVKGAWVPNDQVGELYGSAGVVLNDHWEGMRRDGFLSNRLFDAVACGARVVTDDIPGIHNVFGDQVRAFKSTDDMARLLTSPDTNFPDLASRQSMARQVMAEHSFHRRAEQLIDAAVRAWKEAQLHAKDAVLSLY